MVKKQDFHNYGQIRQYVKNNALKPYKIFFEPHSISVVTIVDGELQDYCVGSYKIRYVDITDVDKLIKFINSNERELDEDDEEEEDDDA